MDYCTTRNFTIAEGVFTHGQTVQEVLASDSCCQQYVCGLPCPEPFDRTNVRRDFGIPVISFMVLFVMAGVAFAWKIRGDAKNFFICNRNLSLFVVMSTLTCQSLDSNVILGNVTLGYRYHFWDGAVFPLGLGLSLILDGLLLAAPIQKLHLLTLPDLFARPYGKLMEVIITLVQLAAFIALLAGNFVGVSLMFEFLFELDVVVGTILAAGVMLAYTAAGGLFSVAYTDVMQVGTGISGIFVGAVYLLLKSRFGKPEPSSGFSVPLDNVTHAITPGFDGSLDCIDPISGEVVCDNFAYPEGDKTIFKDGMHDWDAYAPFPNALLFNWASFLALVFGPLCALDFKGSIGAGIITIVVGVPVALLGGVMRKHFGPDSVRAEFATDTCSETLGLPSCGEWLPDADAGFFKLLWTELPTALGAWFLVGIISASMSTGDGAILAMSTAIAHNLGRKFSGILKVTDKNLLIVARLSGVPMTMLSAMIAIWYHDPGYLVIVATEIMLAGCVIPTFAAVYWKKLVPNAAIAAVVSGSLMRVILEFALPKDGNFIATGKYAKGYGKALPGLPSFMEITPENPGLAEEVIWNPEKEVCDQPKWEDWSGLDTIISPLFGFLMMLLVQLIETDYPEVDVFWFLPKSWRVPLEESKAGKGDDAVVDDTKADEKREDNAV